MSEKETEIKRWTAKRKLAVVMDIIEGRTTTVDVAREHGLTVSEVESWRERFMAEAEEFLRSNPRDEQALHEAEKRELLAKVGELTLAVDALKKRSAAEASPVAHFALHRLEENRSPSPWAAREPRSGQAAAPTRRCAPRQQPPVGGRAGAARRAAIAPAALRELPVFEYAPLRVKQAVVGVWRASKA